MYSCICMCTRARTCVLLWRKRNQHSKNKIPNISSRPNFGLVCEHLKRITHSEPWLKLILNSRTYFMHDIYWPREPCSSDSRLCCGVWSGHNYALILRLVWTRFLILRTFTDDGLFWHRWTKNMSKYLAFRTVVTGVVEIRNLRRKTERSGGTLVRRSLPPVGKQRMNAPWVCSRPRVVNSPVSDRNDTLRADDND